MGKRTQSNEMLPPGMSEVRVVLLGNNQSERNRVGNLLLGQSVFSGVLRDCMRGGGVGENGQMVVINTPDLLDPNISHEELTEKIQRCVRCSGPGPHVFLLVLQPEHFTEEQRIRLQSILENLSHHSFDHSLVLVSTPRQQSAGLLLDYVEYPSLDEMIRKCRFRHVEQRNLDHLELLTRLCQVVKENHGQHVHCDVYDDASDLSSRSTDDSQRPDAVRSGPERAADSGLRIVLLGKSDNKKATLGNSIINHSIIKKLFSSHSPTKQVAHGEWNGKSVRVVKTTNLFSQTVGKREKREKRKEIEEICSSDCSPHGPNVFLLLLKSNEFTEKDRERLKFIMTSFHQEDLNNFIVIQTDEVQPNTSVKQIIADCGGRLYNMSKDHIPSLMEKMEMIVSQHKGRCLTSVKGSDAMTPKSNPPLNLVLCGTRGTSAANTILGQTQYSSGSSSPTECVKRQAEVCGRSVTLVELPSLKTSVAMLHNALRCVSLCDPEGVHAFLLDVPLGPLTDEDKAELQSIQHVFTSEINDFTMVLLTVESDPNAPAYANFVDQDKDIKELCKSYAGRCTVFNIKNNKQVPELLDALEKMRPLRPLCFTREMFMKTQMEKIIQQDKLITTLRAEVQKSNKPNTGDPDDQTLRMVLIGKTGSGKSASGNTILDQKIFTSRPCQKSVTKFCQKEHAEVHGRQVVVVDTPGLFDTSLTQEEVQEEMIKCISLVSPGPHVFLLVLEIGRLTGEEKNTLMLIQEKFGKDSKKFTIILFTNGDRLEHHEQSIEDYVKDCDDSFKKLISDCGGRCHVFNNVDKNRKQVSDLLMKVEKMVKENGGGCYTTEIFQEAEAAIQKRTEKNLKEKEDEMKREVEELKRTHEEEKQTMKVRMKEQEDEIEKDRKKRETQLKEKEDSIKREHEEKEKERVKREEEDKKQKEFEENQRNEWNEKLKALEREKHKVSEEKDRELELKKKEMGEQQDAWEKERRAWLDKRNQKDDKRREEEQNKIKRLQEEFDQEKEKHEKAKKEEVKKIQQQQQQEEEEREKLENDHREKLERMENKYKDEARKQAEKFNEFEEKYQKMHNDFEQQKEVEIRELEQKQAAELEEKTRESRNARELEDLIKQHKQQYEYLQNQYWNIRKPWVQLGKMEMMRQQEKERRKKREKRENEEGEEREKLENEHREKLKLMENKHKYEARKHAEELNYQKEKNDLIQKQMMRQQEEEELEKLENEHREKLKLMENKHKYEARKHAEELNYLQEKYQKEKNDLIQKQKAEKDGTSSS